jgi:hypothetical protein
MKVVNLKHFLCEIGRPYMGFICKKNTLTFSRKLFMHLLT